MISLFAPPPPPPPPAFVKWLRLRSYLLLSFIDVSKCRIKSTPHHPNPNLIDPGEQNLTLHIGVEIEGGGGGGKKKKKEQPELNIWAHIMGVRDRILWRLADSLAFGGGAGGGGGGGDGIVWYLTPRLPSRLYQDGFTSSSFFFFFKEKKEREKNQKNKQTNHPPHHKVTSPAALLLLLLL